jgi:hypothetical protein
MGNKKAIDNFDDLMNFKVNMKLFNKNLSYGGGSSVNDNMQMSKFLNVLLPNLKGGYKLFKGGYDTDVKDFNLIRDVLSPQSQATFTSTNVLGDMSFKSYEYPLEQSLSRTSF